MRNSGTLFWLALGIVIMVLIAGIAALVGCWFDISWFTIYYLAERSMNG